MRPFGYRVVEYANEGSCSTADERVTMLSEADRQRFFPAGIPFVGGQGWQAFDNKLVEELSRRVQPGDFIVHTFGGPHAHLVQDFSQARHVELGVGYGDAPFGAYRVYESEAWRNFHWGAADSHGVTYPDQDRSRSWVVPMSFDIEDWPEGDGDGINDEPFALFLGRLVDAKGLSVISAILDRLGRSAPKIRIVGAPTQDAARWYLGLSDTARERVWMGLPVVGRDRAPLMGSAMCMLMPSLGVEPFGAAGIEGMLCGTPLIASAWGAFVETVQPGAGYLCRTIDDWCEAIQRVSRLDRSYVREYARGTFDMHKTARVYDQILYEIASFKEAT